MLAWLESILKKEMRKWMAVMRDIGPAYLKVVA